MQFLVQALSSGGEPQTLTIEALSEREAHEQASRQGLLVVRVSAVRNALGRRGSKQVFPLLLFSQELLALLSAGLSIVEAMETLAEKESRPEARQVLQQIIIALYEGRPFSQALELTERFPPLYVSTVRASEKTGDLPESLERYIAYQVQLDNMKKQLINAAIYPTLLVAVGGLVTLFLLGFVVPKLASVYDSIANLPLAAQLLMEWGYFVRDHGVLVLVTIAGSIFGAVFALSQPLVRARLMSMAWSIGWVRDKWRIFELARFFRSTGMLLRGGIPAVAAMTMTGGLLHPALRPNLLRAIQRVSEGQHMSDALADENLTTAVAMRMLRVGERAGRMGDMMERIARFYDDDIARWLEWLTSLVGPLLMLVIGVIIGGIVFLLYLPIFELVGNVH